MMKPSAQWLCAVCLLLMAQGVSAEIYKCIDRNGATMLSNLPCSSSQKPPASAPPAATANPTANPLLVNPLATSAAESPKPLERALVEDLFARFARSCSSRDGKMLLEQFSKRMQAYFSRAQQIPLYERIAYMCDNVARYNVKTKGKSFGSIHNEQDSKAAAGSTHNTSSTTLCAYGKPGANKKTVCEPGMIIVFEDGLLKLDER
jgi:hypothetical protein